MLDPGWGQWSGRITWLSLATVCIPVRRCETMRNVLAVLNRTRWKIAGPGRAAEFLGENSATLSPRLRAMKVERQRSGEG
jgi:hypothetical protein